ncbi:MAG: hypothetical protein HZB19_07645 [Chloroflexi bacterium]|nr:hypothetical protein [Chloroflexota bacterium]
MQISKYPGRNFILLLIAFVLFQSCVAFQKVAWGTGKWLGEFAPSWAIGFCLLVLLSASFVYGIALAFFQREKFLAMFQPLAAFREKLGNFRWVIALIILAAPVWFLQFSPWGIVFGNAYFRLMIWIYVTLGLAFFLGKGNIPFGWTEFLVSILLTSSEFILAAAFIDVTDYPFSLGWSEGNRMWDYSIMFGRDLYDYPADKEIWVLLDMGRQFIGGLPFLFPGITIEMERFWIGFTTVFPYIILGIAAFRFTRKDWKVWLFTSLWVMTFLKQGPIHTPLVLCAFGAVLLWRSPLWLGIPLIAATGYIAEESRFTWIFAPGVWIAALELAGAALQDGKLSRNAWIRAVSLGLAGILGGYFGQKVVGLLAGDTSVGVAMTPQDVSSSLSSEPLLWYRLLPNATYGFGILIALLIAVLPLILVLAYLLATRKWTMNVWQSLAVGSSLLAFLIVGLIVSTKIGGGGDLHNMDMFLISLIFTGVLAWQKGGGEWIKRIDTSPIWIKAALAFMLAWPGYYPLMEMRSFSFAGDASWLLILTDRSNVKDLGLLPSEEVSNQALELMRNKVSQAQDKGEVLFMDQRQLLTFGYITDVPFVPEYEKKEVMNQALNSNAGYFATFYDELAAHRFSLIVSEPLFTPIKDVSYEFGEENNAWVKWVSAPILCYYEPEKTIQELRVQLLVPRTEPVDCSSVLPKIQD